MAELADARDSKSREACPHEGSTPSSGKMINLLISTGVAVAIALIFVGLGFGVWASTLPAMVVFLASNILLTRRVGKKVQVLATAAQKEIAAQKFDKGIKILEEGLQFEKWQLLVGPELHANIGILYYVQKRFDEARPHLQKSSKRGPTGARARAMLACLAFQDHNEPAMANFFEQAVKAGKKESIVWAVYAWCVNKLGKRDQAIEVLSRAVAANPTDEKLKAGLVSLQNEKKLKMKAYSFEWLQFHLEKPPPDFSPNGGRRVVYQRR